MSSIFGGSSQKSSSSNQAYPYLQGALSPEVSNGVSADQTLSSLLGGHGSAAQNAAFKNWQGSTGYQFGLNQGSQAITQNNAATGLLNSGATAKALDTYGQQYANTQYQNYLNPLQNLVNSGNQGASVIGGAGQTQQSSGSSNTGGLGGALGSLLGSPGIASIFGI